ESNVLRVNTVESDFDSRLRRLWHVHDAEGLVRPNHLAGRNLPPQAAGLRQPLALSQECLAAAPFLFRPLSVVDVDDQPVPMSDPTLRVIERLSNGLNPSILTVRAPELVDIFIRRSRCGRMQPPSYGRVLLIGMDEFEPPPAGQTLRRVAQIFDGLLIQ